MQQDKPLHSFTFKFSRVIFYFCAFYFLLMGTSLVFFPRFLVQGVAGMDVSPTLIGMLRGSGGAILPYSLLYFLTIQKPESRKWGLVVIATANIIAIVLDLSSLLLNEYELSYAMIDLPVEACSLIAIGLIWMKMVRK